jgi:hypothetical protein
MGKYGTNLEGFGGFEGGVNADNGAALVSTNSDGDQSQLFGPAALREIQAGVANGDFQIAPVEATSAISDENPLPYFSFADTSSGRIVATVADSTIAPGQTLLRFTLTSAIASDAVTFTRYVPVPTSEARTYGTQPRFAVAAATASSNYRITISAQYVRADLTTTTGTSASGNVTGTTMNTDVATAGRAAEYKLNVNGTGNAPADAAFVLLTLSVNATGSVASATLDVSEIRIDRSQTQYLITDQTLPDVYGDAVLYLYQGNLFLENRGLVAGSTPKLFLGAASGDIVLNAKDQGAAITLTSATRAASTVTIVTTRAHGLVTGYEVVVAGITGAAGTTMNGTFIVTVTNTTTFTYTAAGTAGSGTVTSATVKSGPGSGIIYLQPAATAAGRVQVDGVTTSVRASALDEAFTARATADGTARFALYCNGAMEWGAGGTRDLNLYRASAGVLATDFALAATNISLSGSQGVRHDTPATTTQTSSAGIWVLVSGTNYQLRRNSSSARYKTNIVDADEVVLEAARKVKPRHYESTIEDENGATRLGFIAEEIHDAGLTHAVGYDAEGKPETIDPTALIAALWHRVSDLEDRLKALEAK